MQSPAPTERWWRDASEEPPQPKRAKCDDDSALEQQATEEGGEPQDVQKVVKKRTGPPSMDAEARKQAQMAFKSLLLNGASDADLFQAATGLYKPRLQEAFALAGRTTAEFNDWMRCRHLRRRGIGSKSELDDDHADRVEPIVPEPPAVEATLEDLVEAKFDIATMSAKATVRGQELTTTHIVQQDKLKGAKSACMAVFDAGNEETITMKVLGIWWGLIEQYQKDQQSGGASSSSGPAALRPLAAPKRHPIGDTHPKYV